MATNVTENEQLERDLEELMEVQAFPPPEDFREGALVADMSLHEEAANDLEGFWARQADELLDWFSPPDQTLDESTAPLYRWFEGGG